MSLENNCGKCGSVNHLSANYKYAKLLISLMPLPVSEPRMPMPFKPAMPTMYSHNAHAFQQYAQTLFIPNPYLNACNMSQFPWSMPNMNNLCA